MRHSQSLSSSDSWERRPWRMPRRGGRGRRSNWGTCCLRKGRRLRLVLRSLGHGHELSLRPSRGEVLLATLGPDGSVAATFTIPVGKRNLSVDLTGNVKTGRWKSSTGSTPAASSSFPCDRPGRQQSAGGPQTQAANRDTGGAESEIVKGSVAARGTELSDFEDRCVADQ
jgi:hypothetical protein